MNTEPDPSDAEAQAAHAALFKRVSDHLAVAAGKLASLDGEPRLRPVDVAGLFIATGINVLIIEDGPGEALAYMQQLVADMKRGAPVAN